VVIDPVSVALADHALGLLQRCFPTIISAVLLTQQPIFYRLEACLSQSVLLSCPNDDTPCLRRHFPHQPFYLSPYHFCQKTGRRTGMHPCSLLQVSEKYGVDEESQGAVKHFYCWANRSQYSGKPFVTYAIISRSLLGDEYPSPKAGLLCRVRGHY
jgi:hypothetical protein